VPRLAASGLSLLLLLSGALPAQERVDLDMVTRIRQEGFRHSKVMETASELMDRIGPRLTGSPQMKQANEWTRARLAEWGLSNAHLESWGPFGRGWTYDGCSVRMLSPDRAELLALPEAWTPGTNGVVSAKAVRVKATTKEELEKEKGKVAGKIVFLGELREVKPHAKAELERYDEKSLAELFQYEIPGGPPRYDREDARRRYEFRKAADKFFAEEKPLAIVTPGRHDGGTMIVQSGGSYKKGDPPGVPSLVMAVEHFGRISRLLERNVEVNLELDVKARFLEDDLMQSNTFAEIPGTDRRGEVVMLGAHLDSWHAGTGATDNGAGVVITMEAIRILQALGVKPKRTIRVALWSGEEQGLFGSKAYVSEHFASRPEKPEDKDLPWFMQKDTWPITVKPEHAKLSAYFNVDNGTGKVRGIYAQENAAVAPIFEAWMGPLKDLEVTTVTMRNTSSTDHVSFDRVGLPAFQFIQDELEYDTRTHHTNMDVYERLQKEDLMQASVVLATFVYQAATREGLLPRKPMPKEEPSEKKPEVPKKNVAPPERSIEKPPVPAGSAHRG
jgi:carboxypeptidase Q